MDTKKAPLTVEEVTDTGVSFVTDKGAVDHLQGNDPKHIILSIYNSTSGPSATVNSDNFSNNRNLEIKKSSSTLIPKCVSFKENRSKRK